MFEQIAYRYLPTVSQLKFSENKFFERAHLNIFARNIHQCKEKINSFPLIYIITQFGH